MRFRAEPIIVKIAVLGMLLCLLPLMAHADQSAPEAVLENVTHDFGSVFEGNEVVYGFVIKNTGDAPLDIEQVRTG